METKMEKIRCLRCGWTNCMERKKYRKSCVKEFNTLDEFIKYYYQKYIKRSEKSTNYCRDTFNPKHKWYIDSFGVNVWGKGGWFIGCVYLEKDGFIQVDTTSPYFM